MSAGSKGGDGRSAGELIDCAVVQVLKSNTTASERWFELHHYSHAKPERRSGWSKVSVLHYYHVTINVFFLYLKYVTIFVSFC